MKRGDLATLFHTVAPGLRRFLRRFGPAISEEDVAQDAFARLAATRPGSIESPRAWLFRTARNIALTELKRIKTAPTDTVWDVAALDRASDAPSPEDCVVTADEVTRLQSALETLSERHRKALILFKVEGLTHKEIGRRLGVSHRTVERYVADAIAHCHELLSASRAED